MIKLENVTFGYGKEPLFQGLNLKLETGKIYGLLGLNGVGKTTLLDIIVSGLFPQEGKVLINEINSRKRSVEYLKNLFIVPEHFNFQPIKIKTFLKANALLYPHFSYSIFENLLTEFQLSQDMKLSEISSGQAKRFLLSFALSTQTPILLLDEPTNALDIPSKQTFKKMLVSTVAEGSTVVISTHQVADIEGLIDDIIILDKGRIIFHNSIDQINNLITQKILSNAELNTMQEKILYATETFGGYKAILPRKTENDPIVKIEDLFNAVINANEKINNFFNSKN